MQSKALVAHTLTKKKCGKERKKKLETWLQLWNLLKLLTQRRWNNFTATRMVCRGRSWASSLQHTQKKNGLCQNKEFESFHDEISPDGGARLLEIGYRIARKCSPLGRDVASLILSLSLSNSLSPPLLLSRTLSLSLSLSPSCAVLTLCREPQLQGFGYVSIFLLT